MPIQQRTLPLPRRLDRARPTMPKMIPRTTPTPVTPRIPETREAVAIPFARLWPTEDCCSAETAAGSAAPRRAAADPSAASSWGVGIRPPTSSRGSAGMSRSHFASSPGVDAPEYEGRLASGNLFSFLFAYELRVQEVFVIIFVIHNLTMSSTAPGG